MREPRRTDDEEDLGCAVAIRLIEDPHLLLLRVGAAGDGRRRRGHHAVRHPPSSSAPDNNKITGIAAGALARLLDHLAEITINQALGVRGRDGDKIVSICDDPSGRLGGTNQGFQEEAERSRHGDGGGVDWREQDESWRQLSL